jgi:acyl phosphate:glycerol-3-phosphate acyltransferase
MSILQIILIIVLGYLIGSFPNAYVVTLLVKKINIFEVGSGNMGGTNVARTIGLPWGVFTSVLDSVKGMIAVFVARLLVPDASAEITLIASIIGAVAAVSGHNWSFFATALFWYYQKKFEIHGGKGAATAFGTMLVLIPIEANILLLVVGIGLAVVTRYASLAVLVSFTVAFAYTVGWAYLNLQGLPQNLYYFPYVLLLALLIVWRFRENIQRLMAGNERKLGERVA